MLTNLANIEPGKINWKASDWTKTNHKCVTKIPGYGVKVEIFFWNL